MKKAAITGANSYTGQYIAKILKQKNVELLNLSNTPKRIHELGPNLVTEPLDFKNKYKLSKSLEGCDILFNTYWVRFNNYHGQTRQDAVENSKILIDCAKAAGVKKIVFTSHT